jgi:hypothetical protein
MNLEVDKTYKLLHNIIKRAVIKEIKEIQKSIDDPMNTNVKEHLENRKKELEKSLETIIDYVENN